MKLRHSLVFLLSFLILSCTEKTNEKIELELLTSETAIPNDGKSEVSFTVLKNETDITQEAVIYQIIDGNLQILDGNSFSSRRAGEFEFYATYMEYESNHVKVTVNNEIPTIELKASSYNIPNDGTTAAVFTVYDLGKDVTDEAVIYNITGGKKDQLPGNAFTSQEEGIFQFVAAVGDQESKPVSIAVESPDSFTLPVDTDPESTDFANRVMVMKNTGTGCAYCPLVSAAVKETLKDSEYESRMSVVEVHNFNDSDPMMNPVSERIMTVFNILGWPLVIYNMRGDVTSASEGGNHLSPDENMKLNISKVKEIIDAQWVECSDAGISAISKIEGDVIKIKAGIKAGKTAEYHLGVFLLEDNIKSPQNQYGPDTEAFPEDFDPNKHMNVLRATYDGCDLESSDLSGYSLGTVEAGKTAETEFDITIDKEWLIDNCHLVFYVTSKDGEKYVVRNIEKTAIGKKMPLRYN